jgi:hypothetical protein
MARVAPAPANPPGRIVLVLKGKDADKRVGIVHDGREYDFYEGAHMHLPEDVGRAILKANPDLPLVVVKLVKGKWVEQKA